jgi:hypothetical protein
MSWLDDLVYVCVYECEEKHQSGWEGTWEYKPPELECVECGKVAFYNYFEPIQLGGLTRVAYEQNGRMAYRMKLPGGKVVHISQTRHYYQNSANIIHKYSNSYKEVLSARERDSKAKVAAVKYKDKTD